MFYEGDIRSFGQEREDWQIKKASCFSGVHDLRDLGAPADVGSPVGVNSRYAHGRISPGILFLPKGCGPIGERRGTATACFINHATEFCQAVFGANRDYRFFINAASAAESTHRRTITELLKEMKDALARKHGPITGLKYQDEVYYTNEEIRVMTALITLWERDMNLSRDQSEYVAFECAAALEVPYQIAPDALPKTPEQEAILNDAACMNAHAGPAGSHDTYIRVSGVEKWKGVLYEKYRGELR